MVLFASEPLFSRFFDDPGFEGALIGAFIAGTASILTTIWILRTERETRKKEESQKIETMLAGFHAELTVLWEHYLVSISPLIEDLPAQDSVLSSYLAVGSDQCVVFRAHADKLGSLPNRDLQKKIIKAYTLIQSFQDDMALHNKVLETFSTTLAENSSDVGAGGSFVKRGSKAEHVVNHRWETARNSTINLRKTYLRTKEALLDLLHDLSNVKHRSTRRIA